MYKSPIELLVTNIYDQIQKEQDEHIYQAILQYVPNVDREELIRALQYDRNQYDKGYADGKADAMAELVRCKDCDFSEIEKSENYRICHYWSPFKEAPVPANGFCHRGERNDNERKAD